MTMYVLRLRYVKIFNNHNNHHYNTDPLLSARLSCMYVCMYVCIPVYRKIHLKSAHKHLSAPNVSVTNMYVPILSKSS